MKEISYAHISLVLATWDQARFSSKEFEKEFGMTAVKKFLELQPKARKVFGFEDSEEKGLASMQVHANGFAGLFDSVFQMLGPDVEFMEEIFQGIGERHRAMKVSASYFPFMQIALIHAVEKFLERKLTEDEQEAWEDTYEAISGEIVKQILKDE